MREGVCHLLELQVLQQPEFALAFSQVQTQTQLPQRGLDTHQRSNLLFCCFAPQFIIGPFMDVLSEASLFYR